MQEKLTLLDHNNPLFPNPEKALKEPAGLLAIGGNLTTATLLSAYRQGIFPWYEHGQPILWWSPDPRAVIYPEQIHISRSLKKSIKRSDCQVRTNTAFSSVIELCSALRSNSLSGTWITHEMKRAYIALHREGHAHSVEIWQDNTLVGGLYGVLIGRVFCGESMFSLVKDTSKMALVTLAEIMCQQGEPCLIDCQISNDHLLSMGATTIPRAAFLDQLQALKDEPFDGNFGHNSPVGLN
ncbi:leucyl/phenylalanyl-tRNA--protein transferase [uncultured Porticoccus sp.]|uniref:leucyl/phenylalanyl-tRNA--protein transferase n=1 Tax=uncultured Porticoccus sp. TaxID=1256050 RepID=UPI002605B012|nr:leucyl/phenylalanyl-tRNA--protein transferase [uncultured Porticoccus sp.]